ncbi:hypothetical protein Mal15_24430 [Stieleria maiorica]|uniref:Cytochrome c domain-containing protein n=1 Tax=Stieleria maiorica TaxID=2795974 RepID=A0A5B9MAT7_9BACT|nr:hypothetical protein [Stieleria maiorica]QEF98391.1 hypothetical protein Mal15_24430 [Stieleria maiorica]
MAHPSIGWRLSSRCLGAVVVIVGLGISPAVAEESASTPAMQVFEERIMPIFRSPNPSSCVQCHLSSVDLKDYILPSHADTFMALRDGGLVDVDSPEKSKILTLIRMGDKDADPLAKRIHEKTRRAEYEAFSAWITACCSDPDLVSRSAPEQHSSIGPAKPLEVVRHARKSRVLEAFTRNVWSQRMRCFPCHTPDEIDPANPKHEKPAERHREYVKTYGARMNLFRETPEATLAALVASSRKQTGESFPLINLKNPAKSLLVLKPTSKLPPKQDDGTLAKPSSSDPVSHMGGIKMHVDDHSYKLIVAWLEDYAAVVGDHYANADQLPADNWIATQRILRVKGTPPEWKPGTVVQLFVHRQDTSGGWSPDPVAFTQSVVTPRGMVNGALMLIASNLDSEYDGNDESFPLAAGQYLIKAYVDTQGRIEKSPTALLDASDFAGQATINAGWRVGFPNAETFEGDLLAK